MEEDKKIFILKTAPRVNPLRYFSDLTLINNWGESFIRAIGMGLIAAAAAWIYFWIA